jgi:hypothetical protein
MKQIRTISIIDWDAGSRGFMEEPFIDLGYHCYCFDPGDGLPAGTDLFFSFGYFEDFFSFLDKFENLNISERPLFVHWNTEGVPDLRFPKWVTKWGCLLRSSIGRRANGHQPNILYRTLDRKAHRFRYLGNYLYAHKKGLMASMFDCSTIYVSLEKNLGLPVHYIPWGTVRSEYSGLNLERDIDVLWMGKPRGKRRNQLVNSIRAQLSKYGKKMIVIDGVEHPYTYGMERTKLLNRSKITLNLLPAWDAYNHIFKFHLAAGNRSLLISEPFLNHNPEYVEGYHYVSSDVENIVDTLIVYCENEKDRLRITENAFQLVTTSMTMMNSIKKILSFVNVSSESFIQR